MNKECIHNQRTRYTHGFFCEDCDTFFPKDSPTYRSGELLGSIWCVLHNINAQSRRDGNGDIKEVVRMRDKIGIGKKHGNYEQIISESELIMTKYGETEESASKVL